MSEKSLLATMTGEIFQPVRLHYNVFDRKAVLRAFKKLRCVDKDPARLRWVWLYDFRRCNLVQQSRRNSCTAAPHRDRLLPAKSGERMVLDLRSCERATGAAVLRRAHRGRWPGLPRSRLSIGCFPPRTPSSPRSISSTGRKRPPTIPRPPGERLPTRWPTNFPGDLPGETSDRKRVHAIELQLATARSRRRLPIHYYSEGIHGFDLILRTRQIIAYQHWLGNTDYSMADAIHEIVHKVK